MKKEGTELDIRVIALFTIKDEKMIFCDELTYVINGPKEDTNLPAND